MHRLRPTLVVLALLAGCAKEPPATTPPEPAAAATVVRNVDAQPGETTTCPYSGRTFVVKADDAKVEYQGKTYTICSEKAAAEVRADPGKYLDDFDG